VFIDLSFRWTELAGQINCSKCAKDEYLAGLGCMRAPQRFDTTRVYSGIRQKVSVALKHLAPSTLVARLIHGQKTMFRMVSALYGSI
jgi:hypothetical protein